MFRNVVQVQVKALKRNKQEKVVTLLYRFGLIATRSHELKLGNGCVTYLWELPRIVEREIKARNGSRGVVS